MKQTVYLPTEIDITTIRLELPVRYEEEDIPNDFPLRKGDMWTALVDIDTGTIKDWPQGKEARAYLKVCDEGIYSLFDAAGKMVAKKENEYVPHGVVPGEFGDVAILQINGEGVITNWPKSPDLGAFFECHE